MRAQVYRAWNPATSAWVDLDKPNLSFMFHPTVRGKWILLEHHKDGSVTRYENLIYTKFTGLYDDKNREIAEGDVVYAYKQNSGLEGKYVVVWDAKKGRWAYRSGNHIEKYQVGKAGNMHCVINGNIFVNAEFKYILKK